VIVHRWFHSRGRWVPYGAGCVRCDVEREALLNSPKHRAVRQRLADQMFRLQLRAYGVDAPDAVAPPLPPWPFV
jgi:hypothetical protein